MRIVALTGAGISAESGIPTFRGTDGLWEGHRVESVASPEGWEADKNLVLNFYNTRRKNVQQAKPNRAHIALAELDEHHDVFIITQNIDDLHERAGSKNILHLHGEIMKARSERNEYLITPIKTDISIGDMAADGAQLRPHIVWFGEAVPMMEQAIPIVERCDLLLIIGTSMVVYPAASLLHFARQHTPVFVINPAKPEMGFNKSIQFIQSNAASGVDIFIKNHLTNI